MKHTHQTYAVGGKTIYRITSFLAVISTVIALFITEDKTTFFLLLCLSLANLGLSLALTKK